MTKAGEVGSTLPRALGCDPVDLRLDGFDLLFQQLNFPGIIRLFFRPCQTTLQPLKLGPKGLQTAFVTAIEFLLCHVSSSVVLSDVPIVGAVTGRYQTAENLYRCHRFWPDQVQIVVLLHDW